jgi:hypothetical protein
VAADNDVLPENLTAEERTTQSRREVEGVAAGGLRRAANAGRLLRQRPCHDDGKAAGSKSRRDSDATAVKYFFRSSRLAQHFGKLPRQMPLYESPAQHSRLQVGQSEVSNAG